MAKKSNVEIFQGETKELRFTVTKADGTDMDDLASHLIRMRMAISPAAFNKEELVYSKSSDDDPDEISAEGNVASIQLLRLDTLELKPGEYYFELAIDQIVAAYGKLTIKLKLIN